MNPHHALYSDLYKYNPLEPTDVVINDYNSIRSDRTQMLQILVLTTVHCDYVSIIQKVTPRNAQATIKIGV